MTPRVAWRRITLSLAGPTNAFDLTRTPSRLPRATMSPRRAHPVRSNWFGRRSNSFSGGEAEIFNAGPFAILSG